MRRYLVWAMASAVIACVGCGDGAGGGNGVSEPDAAMDDDADVGPGEDTGPQDAAPDVPEEEEDIDLDLDHPPEEVIYDFAGGCVALGAEIDGERRWLSSGGEGYGFDAAEPAQAARFYVKASDLGTYLFYDQDGGYLVAEEGPLLRLESLESDVYNVDDTYISGAEWHLEFSQRVSQRYQLRSRRSERLMGPQGLVDRVSRAAHVELEPVEGCAEHPEMTLDATGQVQRTTYDDGDLFGFVDTHSHILSNFGFGGGGVFHGAPFHRLGVEHAMGSCEPFHGEDGRADMLGFGNVGRRSLDADTLISLLSTGLVPEPNHDTDGWPTFSDWPSQDSSTHQTQYYRWLERAWMGGLRLMVQHAVSNEALCALMADTGFQPTRYGCEDMLNIDRQLEEVRRMERYIDAQSGGPGEGWFKVVESPQEAREVIAQGKLAIVLGIEVPNLFDCYLTRRPDGPVCDEAHIQSQLDRYYELGVRAVFPVHKYDNAFTPGDGSKGIFELGSLVQSGHWSNFVQDCPDVPTAFDKGRVQFGGLNQPRDEYLSDPPNEPIEFSTNPLLDLLPLAEFVQSPPLDGDWCQKATLTEAGTTLIEGMIARGMIIELDHLPRRSYIEVFNMLVEANYPAAGTHGNTNNGQIYELGGISKTGFGRCADPNNPGSRASGFRARRDQIVAAGGYGAEGFGFDLNGLAGVPDARFGDRCDTPQENPVEYPFMSYGGDVTFTEPAMGERAVDFNTEGMIHIGLVPELIEDARRTGVSDEDLDILFRSAEGYIRMWERSRARAAALEGGE